MRKPIHPEGQTTDAMPHSDRLRRIARWLSGGVVALILYGCLFPFELRSDTGSSGYETFARLRFLRPSRGDLVANLLLFLPLGLCLVLALPGSLRRSSRVMLSALAGTLLSLGIELAQVFYETRVSSLTDVVLNAIGSFAGALAGIIYLELGKSFSVPGMRHGRPEPVPLAILLLWITYRLAPFVPTIDWQKYKDALKPVFSSPSLSLLEVMRYLAGWLVVSQALRRLWRTQYALPALLLLAAVVVCGRVVVVSKVLVLSELIALVLVPPAFALLNRSNNERRKALAVALLFLTVIVIEGLKPFELLDTAQSFSWVPFQSSLSDSLELNYMVFFEKCFLYLGLVWLLVSAGLSVGKASLLEAMVLALIEVTQIWLPGRSAEITDPLLALAAGVMVAVMGVRPQELNRL